MPEQAASRVTSGQEVGEERPPVRDPFLAAVPGIEEGYRGAKAGARALAANRRACTNSTETSEGDTPAIRAAMPTVPGRQRNSFSSASFESPFIPIDQIASGSMTASSAAADDAVRCWRSM